METKKTIFFNQKKLLSLTTKIIFSYLLIQSLNTIASNYDLDSSSPTFALHSRSESESPSEEPNFSQRIFHIEHPHEIEWKTHTKDTLHAILELRRQAAKNQDITKQIISCIEAHLATKKELKKTNRSLLDFITMTNESLKSNEETLRTIKETLAKNEETLRKFEEEFKEFRLNLLRTPVNKKNDTEAVGINQSTSASK